MRYLYFLLNIFFTINFFNTFSFKIKIGKNLDKFIFDQWETEKERLSKYFMWRDDKKLRENNESLFLLLELKKKNENTYIAEEYEINGYKTSTKPMFGKDEKCNLKSLEVDFTNENPKYNLKFKNIEMKEVDESGKKVLKEEITDIDLNTDINALNNEVKKYYNDSKDDKERLKEIEPILKNLNKGNFEEKNKRWALFKIKIKDIPSEKYFYCNDIESIYNVGGIFDKEVEEITVIKSNCEDIYFFHCFVSNCIYLKKLHLTNLKTKDDIDINTMFYNCKNLKEVIFPKGLKVENIALLFSNSNNIEKINFEDLKIDNLYSMALLCYHSQMKKIKFPKCKIKKRSILILDKKNIINNVDLDQGFLAHNNLGEIDLTNVEFERNAGKNMFKKNTVKKIILPENMKNLSKQQLKDIFNDCKINIIVIGEYELKIEEYDKIELFIKDPENYLKGREMIKKLYYNEPIKNNNNNNNNNIDQNKDIEENTPKCNNCCMTFLKCFNSCCCCKRNV